MYAPWPICTRVQFVTKSTSEDDCSICLRNLKNKSVFRTPCRHTFHSRCLRKCANYCTEACSVEDMFDFRFHHYKLLNCPLCRTQLWIPIID